MGYGYGGYGWSPYVPVAQRRRKAEELAARHRKQGRPLSPIEPFRRRQLATTFWGRAWCDNAETFASWANRLDRGKRYLRNGSVFHLSVGEGRVEALVTGSEVYEVALTIGQLPGKIWKTLLKSARGQVDSVLDLLQGRLSDGVMTVLTQPRTGLFPTPGEVRMNCSCPDYTTMCKHVAAVFYGVGVRLDESPELLFTLRGVDQGELVADGAAVDALVGTGSQRALAADADDLGALFGIELAEEAAPEVKARPKRKAKAKAKAKPKPKPKPKAKAKAKPKAKPKRKAKSRARALPLPRRLPKWITPAMLLEWGVPRSTFQNWVGTVLERTGERGVYRCTSETRGWIRAVRERLEIE